MWHCVREGERVIGGDNDRGNDRGRWVGWEGPLVTAVLGSKCSVLGEFGSGGETDVEVSMVGLFDEEKEGSTFSKIDFKTDCFGCGRECDGWSCLCLRH